MKKMLVLLFTILLGACNKTASVNKMQPITGVTPVPEVMSAPVPAVAEEEAPHAGAPANDTDAMEAVIQKTLDMPPDGSDGTLFIPRLCSDPEKIEKSSNLTYPIAAVETVINQPDDSFAAAEILRFPVKANNEEVYDFQWVYAVFYPKFTHLKASGTNAIRKYYADKCEEAKLNIQNFYNELDSWVPEEDSFLVMLSECYYYIDWETHIAGNYLSVTMRCNAYFGGVRDIYRFSVDIFDLNTGKLLTKKDVFTDWEIAAPVLERLVLKYLDYRTDGSDEAVHELIAGNRINQDYEGLMDRDFFVYSFPYFRLEVDGIMFIFNEYDISEYATGSIFVFVPYEELREILKPENH